VWLVLVRGKKQKLISVQKKEKKGKIKPFLCQCQQVKDLSSKEPHASYLRYALAEAQWGTRNQVTPRHPHTKGTTRLCASA
jgi:hypothetical protein